MSSILLRMYVSNIAAVLAAGYTEIVIFSDLTDTGTFTTEAGTVPLVPNQTNYEFSDPTGAMSTWYEVGYRGLGPPVINSPKSDPFQGIGSRGPLGLVSIGYLRANTDFPAVAAMQDSKLAEYIWRAETQIARYGSFYGGYDNAKANYTTMLQIAARMVVENLWIVNNPQARARRANGLQSEKIGTYQYTVMKSQTPGKTENPFDFGVEALSILNYYVLAKAGRVHMKTTQVFPEIKPQPGNPLTPQSLGIEVRPWHDQTDIQLSRMVIDVGGAYIEDPWSQFLP